MGHDPQSQPDRLEDLEPEEIDILRRKLRSAEAAEAASPVMKNPHRPPPNTTVRGRSYPAPTSYIQSSEIPRQPRPAPAAVSDGTQLLTGILIGLGVVAVGYFAWQYVQKQGSPAPAPAPLPEPKLAADILESAVRAGR